MTRIKRARRHTLVRTLVLTGALAATAPSALAGQDTHLLVVVGLGGDAEHRQTFHGWAIQLIDAATDRYGVPPDQIHYLGEKTELDPDRIQDRSTSENIAASLRAIGVAAAPGDAVVIVLIGHGTARGEEARFNLPGPDLGPADFALLLDDLSAQRVAFVNTASASGGFLSAMAGENRLVITATRSAREQNETLFGQYFTQAFEGEDADLDKDGRVSLLEAFRYASSEVERFYEDEGLLMTEHAVLDDNGDGVGEGKPEPPTTEGAFAASLFLSPGRADGAAPVAVTPGLQALYSRRDSLQTRVEELRGVRESMAEDDYERRLEDLLVELGLLAREIRDLEDGGSP